MRRNFLLNVVILVVTLFILWIVIGSDLYHYYYIARVLEQKRYDDAYSSLSRLSESSDSFTSFKSFCIARDNRDFVAYVWDRWSEETEPTPGWVDLMLRLTVDEDRIPLEHIEKVLDKVDESLAKDADAPHAQERKDTVVSLRKLLAERSKAKKREEKGDEKRP